MQQVRFISLRARISWGDHELGADPAVEVVAGDVAEGDGGVAEEEAVGVGVLGDLGGAVVADVGGEGGDEDRVLFQQRGRGASVPGIRL